MDWDGNELLLSDILGTDEDVIYRDLEDEIEKKSFKHGYKQAESREQKIVECASVWEWRNEDEIQKS